ncbi:MAG: HD domain-containing phosphohydrolase [Pseudomonadota bacterium]
MTTNAANILFVDDERQVLSSLKRLLRPTGHKIHTASSGSDGLALLDQHDMDIVVSDMRMPEMDGAAFLTQVAEKWPATTRMLLTGYSDLSSAIEAINKGAIYRYLTKPWDDSDIVLCIEQAIEAQRLVREKERLENAVAQQNDELRSLNESLEQKVAERTREIEASREALEAAHNDLQQGYAATIKVFARMVQSRAGLGNRTSVASDAHEIGAQLGLDENQCSSLHDAALLCDVGKLTLPDDTVRTPYTKLGANEQREYHRHPIIAEATLLSLEPLAEAATIIRHHCERYSGKGFPDRLSADEIPLAARILAVTKGFADLLDGRIFEDCMTVNEARSYLESQKGDYYDPAVVDAFLKWLGSSRRKSSEALERKLTLGSLHAGMTMARDLCDEKGVLILGEGQRLTDSLINRLTQLQDAMDEPFEIYVLQTGSRPRSPDGSAVDR